MKDTAPLTVILNPAASGGRGERVRAPLVAGLQARDIPHSIVQTRGPGHARDLAGEAARSGARRILVVGGDGTIHEVANGILGAGDSVPALAVVPVGTGNDFYRVVGSSRRLSKALDLLVTGREQRLDVGKVKYDGEETRFVNLLGVGLDVEVLRRRVGFRRLSGLPQYLAALVATLVRFRSFEVDVSFSGPGNPGGVSEATILAGLTVGPSIGGGFRISPEASPRDGLLDFFFVAPLGPWKVARYVPRVIKGTHGGIPEFKFRQVAGARISRADGRPFFFEVDGELMPEPVTSLEVEVEPGVLPVILPGGSE